VVLTVRPDDEVYQFDTVWLGPDEYTLPIQARYVAWGTWLACFLVTAAVLIPLAGGGPAGMLGSLVWSLAVSVVLSRALMLVVDHERPLRSLPALFSAEARAMLAARRRREPALLVRPDKVRVRATPQKVLDLRDRRKARRRPDAFAGRRLPVARRAGADRDGFPEWSPDEAGHAEAPEASPIGPPPAPAWSLPVGGPYEAQEPVTVAPTPARSGGEERRPRTAQPARARQHQDDWQAAVEARLLLPARKDR
jgi:hypothetical protein